MLRTLPVYSPTCSSSSRRTETHRAILGGEARPWHRPMLSAGNPSRPSEGGTQSTTRCYLRIWAWIWVGTTGYKRCRFMQRRRFKNLDVTNASTIFLVLRLFLLQSFRLVYSTRRLVKTSRGQIVDFVGAKVVVNRCNIMSFSVPYYTA